jgi:hypothetical protein
MKAGVQFTHKDGKIDGIPQVDITGPEYGVQVSIRGDGDVLWVNVDGICALRICNIPVLSVHDERSANVSMADLLRDLERDIVDREKAYAKLLDLDEELNGEEDDTLYNSIQAHITKLQDAIQATWQSILTRAK